MSERLLTTRQVAEFLGISPETVLRRWRAGELRGGPAGGIPGEGSTGIATADPPRTRDSDRSRLWRQHVRLLSSAELINLDGSDPGLELEVGVNAGHASPSRAVAQEADDLDDLAYLGKLLAAVLVRTRRPYPSPSR